VRCSQIRLSAFTWPADHHGTQHETSTVTSRLCRPLRQRTSSNLGIFSVNQWPFFGCEKVTHDEVKATRSIPPDSIPSTTASMVEGALPSSRH